jgi:hypothetical protein
MFKKKRKTKKAFFLTRAVKFAVVWLTRDRFQADSVDADHLVFLCDQRAVSNVTAALCDELRDLRWGNLVGGTDGQVQFLRNSLVGTSFRANALHVLPWRPFEPVRRVNEVLEGPQLVADDFDVALLEPARKKVLEKPGDELRFVRVFHRCVWSFRGVGCLLFESHHEVAPLHVGFEPHPASYRSPEELRTKIACFFAFLFVFFWGGGGWYRLDGFVWRPESPSQAQSVGLRVEATVAEHAVFESFSGEKGGSFWVSGHCKSLQKEI